MRNRPKSSVESWCLRLKEPRVLMMDSRRRIGRNAIIMWRIDPLLGNYSVNTLPLEPTWATIRRLLLGNGSINTPKTIRDNRRRCFPWSSSRGYITGSSKGAVSCCQKLRVFSWRRVNLIELLSRIGPNSGDGNPQWLRRNSKELCCEKKTPCVIWSDSETVKNPLPGYD
jgi:hypothetical protein